MKLSNWDIKFLKSAKLNSTFSKDKTKVGAVIALNKHILTMGYNGFPSRIMDKPERLNHKETKLKYTIHAEMNCILQAVKYGININGGSLYVFGLPPCLECSKHIVASGIDKVVYCEDTTRQHNDKWYADIEFITDMFNEAGIEFVKYDGYLKLE